MTGDRGETADGLGIERGADSRRIVTITMNPALDVSTSVPMVRPDHKMRCEPPISEPGGGGINVARVAKRLGAEVRAVTTAGGATGQLLLELLGAEGLEAIPVAIEGETRRSFSVVEQTTDQQFRFVLPGPAINAGTIVTLGELLRREVPSSGAQGRGPVVVVSGSMPPGTPSGTIEAVMDSLAGADIIVDTSGPSLVEALRCVSLLVKPSVRELSSVVDRPLLDEREVLAAAEEVMAESPAGSLLVSMGSGGALLVRSSRESVRIRAPTVRVRSAVGAGDSLVGGLAVGLAQGMDVVDASALGVAAGTAAVLTEGSGLCRKADVEAFLPVVAIE